MRNDAENLKILEQLRPQYDQLKTAQIRLVAESERLEAEIAAEEAKAVELLGTHDQEEMKKLIHDAWTDNTAVVDEFKSIIDNINATFRQLSGGTASTAPKVAQPTHPMRPNSR